MQELWRNVIFFYKISKRFNKPWVQKVGAAHVHAYRNDSVAGGNPRAQVDANLFPHEHVHAGDEAVLFKQRNEVAGRHHSHLAASPAHKRLGASYRLRGQIIFGLVVNKELAVFKGGLHAAGDFLLGNHFLSD